MQRNKKRKHRKWKNNPTRRNLTVYKNYSRIVKAKNNDTKKHYERRKFHQKSHKPKQFYNYIKSRTISSEPVANLIDNERDRLVTLDSEKAELLR